METRATQDLTGRSGAMGRRAFLGAAAGAVASAVIPAPVVARADDELAGPLNPVPPIFGIAGRRIGTIFRVYPHAGALQSSLCGEPENLAQMPQLATRTLGDFRVWQWMEVLKRYRRVERWTQLVAVNNFVNQIPFVSDSERYGGPDHWACPTQFFSGGGDCEDYVIAKHRSLRWLGVNSERLRLVIGRLEDTREVHAVLAVFMRGRTAILDNRHRDVRLDSDPRAFRPLVSMTDRETWMHD